MAAAVIPLMDEARFEMEQRRRQSAVPEVYQLLDQVKDPELPVLSIWDLGVLQDVNKTANGQLVVTITPTYSGCPALAQMTADITACLNDAGYPDVQVEVQLAPAWSTDWLSATARGALVDFGVAAPGAPVCPQCGSDKVSVVSEFAATACKSLLRCDECAEPFDYFKPH